MNEISSDADAAAAHEFLAELRTRITTQTLPYQYGVEARALESLWEMFGHARSAMKNHPGCGAFAHRVTTMLNHEVRPVTSKWHRAHESGVLATRDGADGFRPELAVLQKRLRDYARQFELMAYGETINDEQMPAVLSKAELRAWFAPLAYGIPAGGEFSAADNAFAAMNVAEKAAVAVRRHHWHVEGGEEHNAVGLALSGGGIRSATFCLGVVQALAARGLLHQVDYLSTVSGGGYTGSFLTTRLGNGAAEADLAGPHGPDPEPVRYLRQHAQFLTAYSMKDRWAKVTATVAGMLLNWTSPLLLLVAAALGAHQISQLIGAKSFNQVMVHLAQGCSALTLLSLGLYAVLIRCSRQTAAHAGQFLGGATALLIAVLLAWAIAAGYEIFQTLVGELQAHTVRVGALASLLSVVSIAGPAILRFVPWLKKPAVHAIALKLVIALAAIVVPVLGLVVFYLLRMAIDAYCAWPFVVVGGLLAVFALFVIDINHTSMHRLYRDGLGQTFVQNSATESSPVALHSLDPHGRAPYHLINAALNIPSSASPALRDRRCDFFLFSKHWSGAPSCGYFKTDAWMMGGQPPDLASAMAISGAAVAPHMGLGSMPTLTALLTFLNIRLSYWIGHPDSARLGGAKHPGFICLLREMMGVNMSEDQPWLNLSDGGHIENMAIYELLRRRCKFIVCVDGESDPEFRFQGLMTLVRHAQIDFGIRIEPGLDELRPVEGNGLSRAHAHLCRIEYPEVAKRGNLPERDAGMGFLLYIKLSVTGNESELIKRYRIMHPEFPHQITLDQFFDQEQFEAYRQLGVHALESMFADALMNGSPLPASIPEWFGRLAGNLLEPRPGFVAAVAGAVGARS